MSKNPDDPQQAANCSSAGVLLATFVLDAIEARREGRPLPEPDMAFARPADDYGKALQSFASFLELETMQQRQRLQAVFAMFADVLSDRGAEIEGTMYGVINPDDPQRKSMVVRMRQPDNKQ